jgi:hypothetical protein
VRQIFPLWAGLKNGSNAKIAVLGRQKNVFHGIIYLKARR